MTYYFIGKHESDIQGAFFYIHQDIAQKDLDSYQVDNYQDEFKLFEVEVTKCQD